MRAFPGSHCAGIDLLEYIEERRVIPIVGAELLTVPDGAGGEVPLQRLLAQKLAERLRVPADDCLGDDALHQVVCRYVQRGGRREEVYPRLRNELKSSHLLLIGNTFPDWLTRFFIRIAKSGRLSLQREELEIIADRRTHEDKNLVLFLKIFSYRTQVFEQGNAADFVRELSTRYAEKHPAVASATVGLSKVEGQESVAPNVIEVKPGAVFLSYASQDAEPVKKIRDALEAAGIEVWFDQRRLEGGDNFDQQIKKNICGCSLLPPDYFHEHAGAARGLLPSRVGTRRRAHETDRRDDPLHPARRDRSGARPRRARARAVPAGAVDAPPRRRRLAGIH